MSEDKAGPGKGFRPGVRAAGLKDIAGWVARVEIKPALACAYVSQGLIDPLLGALV